MKTLTSERLRELMANVRHTKVLVVGDVMLDQFIWGSVNRISPEAPVPVVEFERESFMPGGAANVARNLTALGCPADLFSYFGRDEAGRNLRGLLIAQDVGCEGLIEDPKRTTSIKTRVIAHHQQVVRVDRESRMELEEKATRRLLSCIDKALHDAEAVIVGDYGKGVITQFLLDELKTRCRDRGIWLSMDPKPVHQLNLSGLSLITPNRKEAHELAGIPDLGKHADPLSDAGLRTVMERIQEQLNAVILLVTLGEQGMMLCQRGHKPFHIPTVAREIYDVSGAGDTVIASFTLAIAAGASPEEAAIFSNHAAGVVVGKVGTATATVEEINESFQPYARS